MTPQFCSSRSTCALQTLHLKALLEKVESLEAAQGYALCEQWEESAEAFVHSQSICDLNTGEKGIEGEAK